MNTYNTLREKLSKVSIQLEQVELVASQLDAKLKRRFTGITASELDAALAKKDRLTVLRAAEDSMFLYRQDGKIEDLMEAGVLYELSR